MIYVAGCEIQSTSSTRTKPLELGSFPYLLKSCGEPLEQDADKLWKKKKCLKRDFSLDRNRAVRDTSLMKFAAHQSAGCIDT